MTGSWSSPGVATSPAPRTRISTSPATTPGFAAMSGPPPPPPAACDPAVRHLFSVVIEPGFFQNAPVRLALLAGGVVAVVSGIVGSFAVIRGQSYAGHALADISVTGGSASFLVGISPLWGFVGIGVVAAGIMDMIGIRRPRGSDLATGIVRGAGLGLAALFLYSGTTPSNTTGATITILFGSVFTINSSIVPVVTLLSVLGLGIVVVL